MINVMSSDDNISDNHINLLKLTYIFVTKSPRGLLMKKVELDHVERLSYGKRSGINIGSRSVGHYLRPYERDKYQRALKKGYLDITEKDRANLWHIWEKACLAKGWDFLILLKDQTNGSATLYRNSAIIMQAELTDTKVRIKQLALSNPS